MNTVEVSYNQPLESVKIFVNQTLVAESADTAVLTGTVDCLPAGVEVEFKPYGIKPVVRFNDYMLNYWLANVLVQDHKLEFTISKNFYKDYKNKDIAGRLAHLTIEEKSAENMYDKYIGINNLYPELVKEIKEFLK